MAKTFFFFQAEDGIRDFCLSRGLGIGYGLDHLLGTLPLFLIIFTILGFAAGVRTMMRTAQEVQIEDTVIDSDDLSIKNMDDSDD